MKKLVNVLSLIFIFTSCVKDKVPVPPPPSSEVTVPILHQTFTSPESFTCVDTVIQHPSGCGMIVYPIDTIVSRTIDLDADGQADFDNNPYLFANRLLENFINEIKHTQRTIHSASLIEIPVCYDPSLGIDLQSAAIRLNCSVEHLIQQHSEKVYTVYCLGFLPGFAYMGDVSSEIQLPRHPTPSAKVLGGSVGIAGKQTGIYPITSPGGWQIIGRTPIKIFDANSKHLTLFKAGDQVKFKPISLALFHQLNTYQDVD